MQHVEQINVLPVVALIMADGFTDIRAWAVTSDRENCLFHVHKLLCLDGGPEFDSATEVNRFDTMPEALKFITKKL